MIAQAMHKKTLLTFCSLVLLILTSCNNNVVYSKYEKLPETGWNTDNKLSYEVEVNDVTSLHSVFLTVRHADSYPYNNLFVFLTTTYPNGKSVTDTCELILANEKGEWIGDGAGDIWDDKIPLKQNVKFPQAGKYKFTFEQGMRTNPLPLIMDFGMVIEKIK